MSYTMMEMNLGTDMLNSKYMNLYTFLHFSKEYFFNSPLIFLTDILSKHLFWLSGMLQALVIIINVQDKFILEVHQLILIIQHLHLQPLSLQLLHLLFLEKFNRISNTLYILKLTLTNYMKI